LQAVEQANANDPAIFERFSEERFPDCFTEVGYPRRSTDSRWLLEKRVGWPSA
jgi:hypothetical protein